MNFIPYHTELMGLTPSKTLSSDYFSKVLNFFNELFHRSFSLVFIEELRFGTNRTSIKLNMSFCL